MACQWCSEWELSGYSIETGLKTYSSVTAAWMKAMKAMDRLISGVFLSCDGLQPVRWFAASAMVSVLYLYAYLLRKAGVFTNAEPATATRM